VSCGKVCEEGFPKVKLEQDGEESWEGSVKKVAEGSDATCLGHGRSRCRLAS